MNSISYYDVVIIGAGPAGLFTAYKIHKFDPDLKILIIEKGKSYEERYCPVREANEECRRCKNCELISGEGGAGLFSDGKMVFTLDTGTSICFSPKKKRSVLDEIRKLLKQFDGEFPDQRGPELTRLLNEQKKFQKAGLTFDYFPVWHLGTFRLKRVMKNFLEYLHKQRNINFMIGGEVVGIKNWSNPTKKRILIKCKNGSLRKINIITKNIIFAVGKEGSFLLARWLKKKGVKVRSNRCYFGMRLELPTKIFKELLEITPNPKIHKYYDGIHLKTHCFCQNGQVLLLKYYGLPLAGGHTYENNGFKTGVSKNSFSNFSVLLGKEITYPEIMEKSLQIMEKVNGLTKGYLLAQRMEDFLNKIPTSLAGKRTKTIARPGNIAELYKDSYPFFVDFITRLNKVIPGITNKENWLYAPAVEWWMPEIELNDEMETSIKGIYVIGDASGKTQGIIQSMASACLAADSILNKIHHEKIKQKILPTGYDSSLQEHFGESISS